MLKKGKRNPRNVRPGDLASSRKNKIDRSLNIVMEGAGKAEGFGYSKALVAMGGNWITKHSMGF